MGKTKNHKNFFQKDSVHGLVKRVIYKKYIQAYIAVTQNSKLKTIIIDGFSGPGRYAKEWSDKIEKYGSPLIALMVSLEYCLTQYRQYRKKHLQLPSESNPQYEDRIFGWESSEQDPESELREISKKRTPGVDTKTSISMIFIEADELNYKSLVSNIELMIIKFLERHFPDYDYRYDADSEKGLTILSMNRYPFSFSVRVLLQTFKTFKPPDELKDFNTRSLTFLDPFGYSHTPMRHVKMFAPGEGNEIFITFMSREVNRWKSNFPEHVCDLYGLGCELKEIESYILSSNPKTGVASARNNIKKCTEIYKCCLKDITSSSYLQTFEIRNKNNAIIYHLIHITNSIKGVESMKEAMNRCSQKQHEMVMSEYDIYKKGQKLNFKNLDDPKKVADKIFEKFRGQKDILLQPSICASDEKGRWARTYGMEIYDHSPTIKEYVLLDTAFLFRKKPLAILQKDGRIVKVVDENGFEQKRKNTFPDKERITQRTKQWRISFASEAPRSDKSSKSTKFPPEKRRSPLKEKDIKNDKSAETKTNIKRQGNARLERKHLEKKRKIHSFEKRDTVHLKTLQTNVQIGKVVDGIGLKPNRKSNFSDRDNIAKRKKESRISFGTDAETSDKSPKSTKLSQEDRHSQLKAKDIKNDKSPETKTNIKRQGNAIFESQQLEKKRNKNFFDKRDIPLKNLQTVENVVDGIGLNPKRKSNFPDTYNKAKRKRKSRISVGNEAPTSNKSSKGIKVSPKERHSLLEAKGIKSDKSAETKTNIKGQGNARLESQQLEKTRNMGKTHLLLKTFQMQVKAEKVIDRMGLKLKRKNNFPDMDYIATKNKMLRNSFDIEVPLSDKSSKSKRFSAEDRHSLLEANGIKMTKKKKKNNNRRNENK